MSAGTVAFWREQVALGRRQKRDALQDGDDAAYRQAEQDILRAEQNLQAAERAAAGR